MTRDTEPPPDWSDPGPMWTPPDPDAPTGPAPVDWSQFWKITRTEPDYLLPPLIARGEICRVYAPAKAGKSLLVLEGAVILTTDTGGTFIGERLTDRPITVVYIDQENTAEDWHDRLTSLGVSEGSDLSRLIWYSLQSWPPLDTAEGGQALLSAVQRHRGDLAVLDTQSKLLQGDEDRQPTSAAFYRHTLLPLKRAGIAVLILDHAGNDVTKPRGSTGKRDDVDSVWSLRPRGADRVTLKVTHTRRRREVTELHLIRTSDPLRHVPDDLTARDEEFIARCVDAIAFLDPDVCDPRTESARAVAKALRDSGKKFREATIREAYKRFREMTGTGQLDLLDPP